MASARLGKQFEAQRSVEVLPQTLPTLNASRPHFRVVYARHEVVVGSFRFGKKTQSPNCFSSVPGKPGLTNAVSSMDSMFNLEETSPRMMKTLEGMKLVGVELAIICIFRDLNLKVIPAPFLGSAPPKSTGVRAKSRLQLHGPLVMELQSRSSWCAIWKQKKSAQVASMVIRNKIFTNNGINHIFDLSLNVRLLWFGSFDKTKAEAERWCIWCSASL